MMIKFLLDRPDRCLSFFICRYIVRTRVKRKTFEAVLSIPEQRIYGNQVGNYIAFKNNSQRIL
ncbi:MAG TPA: hypothetical protein QGG30_04260, partial [Acidobacteriota bacterium]|nr:hypothetical protein [Acidobacteriota bacterium]